ncbi:MAG TPA: sigma factor [Methylocella sp.]|nr:sigma factor [Methylocella sp.]
MEADGAASREARRAVERAARASYGRLIAFLAARSGDVAAAEDALADAFKAALESWPQDGAPQNPEAWLLTVARRRQIDRARQLRLRQQAALRLQAAAVEAQQAAGSMTFPDGRLKLMFVCAHPAIDAAARMPLMLQTVLGLDAARIASAFLVRPATMGQRLSRAKAKIRDAKIAFEVPAAKDLPLRLGAVTEAIYAAYGSGWDDIAGADPRRSAAGDYVPLALQDVGLWLRPMIEEADRLLASA